MSESETDQSSQTPPSETRPLPDPSLGPPRPIMLERMDTPPPTESAHGRVFQAFKKDKYLMPADDEEAARLDLQHCVFKQLFNFQLYFAPITPDSVKYALDIATGTGTWAIELAYDFPNTMVFGTDLHQPKPYSNKPANCKFIVQDAEEDWSFDQKFDYIHARLTLTCFADYKKFLRKAYEFLSPGGWLEIHEPTFPAKYKSEEGVSSNFARWNKLNQEAGIKVGRPWADATKFVSWFQELGLENVNEKYFFLPIGHWSGEESQMMGEYQKHNYQRLLTSITYKSLERLGWTHDETTALIEKVDKELAVDAAKLKAYNDIVVIYGQKPF